MIRALLPFLRNGVERHGVSLICLMGRKTWSDPMQVGITGLSNGNPPVSAPPGPQKPFAG